MESHTGRQKEAMGSGGQPRGTAGWPLLPHAQGGNAHRIILTIYTYFLFVLFSFLFFAG